MMYFRRVALSLYLILQAPSARGDDVQPERTVRYFLWANMIQEPWRPIDERSKSEAEKRRTYFKVEYDDGGKIVRLEKVTEGSPAIVNEYTYYPSGRVREIRIEVFRPTKEPVRYRRFDEQGDVIED